MKFKKILGGMLISTLVLTGCGNNSEESASNGNASKENASNESASNKSSVLKVSKELTPQNPLGFYEDSQKNDRIWLHTDISGFIQKDSEVYKIFVVKDGKMTTYITRSESFNDSESLEVLELGALNKLSTKEVEKLAIERDKEYFELYKARVIEYLEKEIPDIEKQIKRDEERNHVTETSEFSIEWYKELITEYKEHLISFKNLEYEKPKPQEIVAEVETDGSGNNTMTEDIDYKYKEIFFDKRRELGIEYGFLNNELSNKTFSELMPMTVMTIFEENYAGFYVGESALVTLSDEKYLGQLVTKLDPPTIEGLKVDED